MRLLFDEQLSERLPALLADSYPDSLQVRLLDAGGASDERIWELAREHECILVTKDEDFHRLSVIRGAPPKVIWVRLGNSTSEEVASLLREHLDDVRRFAEHEDASFLALGRSGPT